LAAVCIGQHFGVPDELIAGALTEYTPSNNRSQFSDTGRNHLILDAYNANPTSMAAALRNFAAMASERPKLAILGDMRELGAESPAEHAAIVNLVRELGLDAHYVGPEFQRTTPAQAFPDAAALLTLLKQEPLTGHLVLVKGSRGIRLETVVEGL
jgi:UDP-N-acetylmuramoyl-tripeptide--D-alanyl-D-alanine ligase